MANVALRTCGNCAARFRFAVHHPTLGGCCPICHRPVETAAANRSQRVRLAAEARHANQTGLADAKPEHRGCLQQVAARPTDRVAVYVDASFEAGTAGGGSVAGLGVTGALGEYTRRVVVRASMIAERWALETAIEIAVALDRRDLVFHSDCLTLVEAVTRGRLQHILPPGRGWTVEHVPRARNKRAHELAGHARRAGQQPDPPGPKGTHGWLEANPVPRWSPIDREVGTAKTFVVSVHPYGERYRALVVSCASDRAPEIEARLAVGAYLADEPFLACAVARTARTAVDRAVEMATGAIADESLR